MPIEQRQEKKKQIIISGFPAIGKTSLATVNNKLSINSAMINLRVTDIESSFFSKMLTKEGQPVQNPKFPNNYFEFIQQRLPKYDFLLISSHKEVRDLLVKNDRFFYLAYPLLECKDEFLERCKKRNNSKIFIDNLAKNYDNWIKELDAQGNCIKIRLNPNEYLVDKIQSILVHEDDFNNPSKNGSYANYLQKSKKNIQQKDENQNEFNTKSSIERDSIYLFTIKGYNGTISELRGNIADRINGNVFIKYKDVFYNDGACSPIGEWIAEENILDKKEFKQVL